MHFGSDLKWHFSDFVGIIHAYTLKVKINAVWWELNWVICECIYKGLVGNLLREKRKFCFILYCASCQGELYLPYIIIQPAITISLEIQEALNMPETDN